MDLIRLCGLSTYECGRSQASQEEPTQVKETLEVVKQSNPGGGQIQSLTVNNVEEANLVLQKYFNLTGFSLMQDEREVATATYVTTEDNMRIWVGPNNKIIGLDNMKAWKELKIEMKHKKNNGFQ